MSIKLKIFLVLLIQLILAQILVAIMQDRRQQEVSHLIEVDSVANLPQDQLVFFPSALYTDQPAEIYDLKVLIEEPLALVFSVSIYQLTQHKTYNHYHTEYEWVDEIPSVNSRRVSNNPNYEHWPIPYKSTKTWAKNIHLDKEIVLEQAAIVHDFNLDNFLSGTAQYFYDIIPFLAPDTLLGYPKKIEKSSHSFCYYYGTGSSRDPHIGDIRISLRGFGAIDSLGKRHKFHFAGYYRNDSLFPLAKNSPTYGDIFHPANSLDNTKQELNRGVCRWIWIPWVIFILGTLVLWVNRNE